MKKLIFVYNANSSKLSTLFDIGHKMVSPSTYQCSLCALTHGALFEKKAWSHYKKNSQHHLLFLHKDEFEKSYRKTFQYPVILIEDNMETLFTAEELSQFSHVDTLINALIEAEKTGF